MGKRVSKALRKQAEKLVELYRDRFSTDFETNKQVLKELGIYKSKTQRNVVAGIICRLMKRAQV